jgi:hypothetical protein
MTTMAAAMTAAVVTAMATPTAAVVVMATPTAALAVRDRGRSESLEYYLGYLRTTTNTPPRFMAEP